MENIANFFLMDSSFPLACYHFEEYKSLNIKDNISQPPISLVLGHRWEIIRHIRFRKPHWILDNIVAIIHRIIKKKVYIVPKP